MKRWGKWAVLFSLTLILTLLLGGCGSGGSADDADGGSYQSTSSSANKAVSDSKAESMEVPAAESEAATADGSAGGAALPSGEEAARSAADRSGFQGADPATGLNKKLIYRANVVMEVADYAKAQSEIRNLITLAGGYIMEFSEQESTHELGGTFILKVPASGFSSFLDRLEDIKPESLQQSIQGQDVSEEYVDLESRLKVKQATEERYLKFIDEATKTTQLVEYVNELERIQTEIEQIKGRMRYIDSNVSFSTIEIRVYQPEDNSLVQKNEAQAPLLKRVQNALTGSIEVISVMLQWVVVIIAGALPVLAIAVVIGVLVWLVRRKGISRGGSRNSDRSAERSQDKTNRESYEEEEKEDNDLR